MSTPDNIEDKGIIVLMYHRFEENKYPSTNIKIADFYFNDIKPNFNELKKLAEVTKKNQKKILLNIDDGFKSFYEQA